MCIQTNASPTRGGNMRHEYVLMEGAVAGERPVASPEAFLLPLPRERRQHATVQAWHHVLQVLVCVPHRERERFVKASLLSFQEEPPPSVSAVSFRNDLSSNLSDLSVFCASFCKVIYSRSCFFAVSRQVSSSCLCVKNLI